MFFGGAADVLASTESIHQQISGNHQQKLSATVSELCALVREQAAQRPKLQTAQLAAKLAHIISRTRYWQTETQDYQQRGMVTAMRLQFTTADRAEMTLHAVLIRGSLRGVRLEHHDDLGPRQLISMDPTCRIAETRYISSDSNGIATEVEVNTRGLPAYKLPLNPPPPQGLVPLAAASGDALIIGHIDSGIDYRRPDFRAFLRSDQTGQFIGLDLWDDDGLPFDADTAVSAFFPRHHGSLVADILTKSGIAFSLLPVRYPRQNMSRMAEAVDWLAKHQTGLIMLPMGSSDAGEWQAFLAAAALHKEILFIVSAGNDGVNLSENPVYPAVNDLDNIITVTSTLGDGSIAEGSNDGAMIDIGLAAEDMPSSGIDARPQSVSGSSFAVPKLAAYALCLAARNKSLAGDAASWAGAITGQLGQSIPPAGSLYRYFLSDRQISADCPQLNLP